MNIRDAQMDRDVRRAFAAGLVFCEALSVDRNQVGLVTGARESERTMWAGGSVLFTRCL
jgi:hypothetical protein